MIPFFFLCFLSVSVFDHSAAQSPIPAKYDGFVYGGGSPWKNSVIVDAFLDPMCPDSRDSWPPLKQALDFYQSRVSLSVHPFALPYHSNSYASCRALHIADNLNASSTYPLLELFFKYQESYYNAPTYNSSRAHITVKFSKIAEEAVGKGSYEDILSGFHDSKTDMAARISFKRIEDNKTISTSGRTSGVQAAKKQRWSPGICIIGRGSSVFPNLFLLLDADLGGEKLFQYGCSRGVMGTPSFFVNGIPLPDYGSALNYSKWKSIIDPLFAENK